MLLDISNGAAGHDHDLALYRIAQGCKIFRSTEAVDEDIFVVTSNGGDGTVHIASLCVEDHVVANCNKGAYIAGVVYRGNGERIGVGTGRTAGVEVHVLHKQVFLGVGVLRPIAVVAHGRDQDSVCLRERIQQLGIGLASGFTGQGRAQGHIHGIAAQQNGVFDGRHVVGVIGSAAFAKDLHGNNLGIRGHTLYQNLIQGFGVGAIAIGYVGVGSSNARHMRPVLRLGIVVMGHI